MNLIVINLTRATDRRIAMEQQLETLGLEAHFLEATDGRALREDELDHRITLPGWFRFGELMRPGEIACTLSHIRALEFASAQGMPDVVIFEDDVVLADDFPERVALLRRILPADWEHVYLSGGLGHRPSTRWLGIPHLTPSRLTTGTFAMMVRSSAYEHVLAKLRTMDAAADDLYGFMIAIEGTLRSYTYYPFPAYTAGGFSYIREVDRGVNHMSSQCYRRRARGYSEVRSRAMTRLRWAADAPGRLWEAVRRVVCTD